MPESNENQGTVTNLHYLFNIEYFESDTKVTNDALKNSKFERDETDPFFFSEPISGDDQEKCPQYQTLCLETLYPGLLMGLGYPHELGPKAGGNYNINEAIKLGFSLDYVTGLPYIPGSTVKGILRNAFTKEINNEKGRVQLGAKYLNSINKDITTGNVKKLEEQIFGARAKDVASDQGNERGGDVFFDAWPIKTNGSGKLLAFDVITPHNTTEKPRIKNPKPLRLLKVPPGVIFILGFKLSTSTIEVNGTKEFTPEHKMELFTKIFEDFGIGAKTNVGFGSVEAVNQPDSTLCRLKQKGAPA